MSQVTDKAAMSWVMEQAAQSWVMDKAVMSRVYYIVKVAKARSWTKLP
jgi:hypothetical protein